MADYPHVFKDIDKMLKEVWDVSEPKVWSHKRSRAEKMLNEPNLTRYKNYSLETVPLDDLIKGIDISALRKDDKWGDDITKYKYDPNEDSNPLHIINAKRDANGNYKINEGQHRLLALKNGGYTHVTIPIYDSYINETNEDFKSLYWNTPRKDYPRIKRQLSQMVDMGNITKEDADKIWNRMLDRSPFVDFLIRKNEYRRKL